MNRREGDKVYGPAAKLKRRAKPKDGKACCTGGLRYQYMYWENERERERWHKSLYKVFYMGLHHGSMTSLPHAPTWFGPARPQSLHQQETRSRRVRAWMGWGPIFLVACQHCSKKDIKEREHPETEHISRNNTACPASALSSFEQTSRKLSSTSNTHTSCLASDGHCSPLPSPGRCCTSGNVDD